MKTVCSRAPEANKDLTMNCYQANAMDNNLTYTTYDDKQN